MKKIIFAIIIATTFIGCTKSKEVPQTATKTIIYVKVEAVTTGGTVITSQIVH